MMSHGCDLAVYVLGECPGCSRALELAGEVRCRIVNVTVRIVDLSDRAQPQPACVFSAPTWVLNGRVISLGNPRFSALVAAVSGCRGTGGAGNGHPA